MKSFDFNALKKRYFTVTLNDEKKTKLMINTPTKKILDEFISMKDSMTDENRGEEVIDELYDIVAKLMSHNKTGVKVTRNMVDELFDFEDIIMFIRAYTEFISDVANSKNF